MHGKLFDVIEYAGEKDVLVWKSDIEDFNTKSQLIVDESQEAIFYKDGQALDLFGPGKHTLNSSNLPIIRKLFEKLFNGNDPFPCSVYFINKVNILDILWGTDSPITLEDPLYHIFVNARAFGQMGIVVSDSRKFILKLVGTLPIFDVASLKTAIKGNAIAHIKNEIAKVMITERISFLEISTRLLDLSKVVKEKLNEDLQEFGITLVNFFINNITVGQEEYAALKATKEKVAQQYAELDFEAEKTVRMGEAMAKARAAQGYSYQEERKFDVLENAASNEGAAGTLMGAGIGLGVGATMAKNVNSAMNEVSNSPAATPAGKKCPKCGASVSATAKFCPECGSPIPQVKFCSECGAKLDPNAKFCPECGKKVE